MVRQITEYTTLMDNSHYISDETTTFNISGLKYNPFKLIVTTFLVILSGGTLLLFMYWYPNLNVKLTKQKTLLKRASFVYVEDELTNTVVKMHRKSDGEIYFIFQNLKYVWESSSFTLVSGLEFKHFSELHFMSHGLSMEYYLENIAYFGANVIHVPVPSYLVLILKQIVSPFYIFQGCAVLLWFLDDYVAYATCIVIISVISIGLTIYEERTQFNKINKMAASFAQVMVIRENKQLEIDSSDLVPGDVLMIPKEGMSMCCDVVIISGNVIVNECALTGESVPVTKVPIPYISKHIYDGGHEQLKVSEDLIYDPNSDKKYSLYSGTDVIQARSKTGEGVLSVVTRTGFCTTKGSLIRSILCPKPVKFEFESDAQRFILMLGFFALCGFCYTVYISQKLGGSVGKTIRLGLDLITVVVPPALPAALTIGIVYAIGRLKVKKIYCIDPPRINLCGKIEAVCFDKTGTLTEDGLSVLGVISHSDSDKIFGDVMTSALTPDDHLMHALATCHELTLLHGQVIGDPLDIEMFKFTGWNLDDLSGDGTNYSNLVETIVSAPFSPSPASDCDFDMKLEIGIIKTFPFSSDLQRMTVVSKNLLEDNMGVYCKGSPEMIEMLCIRETVPKNFDAVLQSYTKEGYRVIAFAWKQHDGNWHETQHLVRSQVESELNFLGLMVMENCLKDDTTEVITELTMSRTNLRMITGDNILTAITVGRKCGIIPINHDVVVMKQVGHSVGLHLDFHQDKMVVLDVQYSQNDIINAVATLTRKQHVFAFGGKDFGYITENHPVIQELMLLKGAIFARMTPGQKQKLVEDLQAIGYTVSMCGDGANDCGALKAAHAGVSLSEAEASIAAPFTSATPSISCMVEILKQGRAALIAGSVTFRFMAMYSMIQFITQLIHFSFGSSLGDWQFLYIDMFLISGIAATLGHTHPAPKLAPHCPKGQLIDLKVAVLLIMHVALTFAFQFGTLMLVESQPWFKHYIPAPDLKEHGCYENTALFIISGYQYCLYGIILSQGAPFRKPVYTNYRLLTVFIIFTGVSVLFVFQPWPALTDLMELKPLHTFKLQMTFICLMALNFFLALLIELSFATLSVTQFFESIKCAERKQPQYKEMTALWGNLTNEITIKNFYS